MPTKGREFMLPDSSDLVFVLDIEGVEVEMLRISAKGFYVQGHEVSDDQREKVYHAFKDWLIAMDII